MPADGEGGNELIELVRRKIPVNPAGRLCFYCWRGYKRILVRVAVIATQETVAKLKNVGEAVFVIPDLIGHDSIEKRLGNCFIFATASQTGTQVVVLTVYTPGSPIGVGDDSVKIFDFTIV